VDLHVSAVTATIEKNIFYWFLVPNGPFYEMNVVPRRIVMCHYRESTTEPERVTL